MSKREVKLWGGFGEKKSNGGSQWYVQDRVYDSEGLCPALTLFGAYWIVIRTPVEEEGNHETK